MGFLMQNKDFKILCVGIGQIGRYHLASILSSKLVDYNLQIFAADPSPQFVPNVETVKYYSSLDLITEETFDAALINTKSDVRYDILNKILKTKKCKIIYLEKLLFNQMSAYNHNFDNHDSTMRVWTSVRLQPLYHLSKHIDFEKIDVEIPKGSLMTDIIHYVDFYFTDVKAEDIEVLEIELLSKPFPSKRLGNLELDGNLVVRDKITGKSLHFTSNKTITNYRTIIYSKNKEAIIDEKESSYTEYLFGKVKHRVSQRMLYQSEISGNIIYNDLVNNKNALLSINRAIELQKALHFPIVQQHRDLIVYKNKNELPFT